jgi:hypothetical protein
MCTMDNYGSSAVLSTHISTDGGAAYGVFDLSGPMLGKLVVAMLAFIVIAALVAIKHEYAPQLYNSRPSFLAVGTVTVSALAVVVCLGALLVTWWTEFNWGSGDGIVDVLVVIASAILLVAYGLGVVAAYETLFDN